MRRVELSQSGEGASRRKSWLWSLLALGAVLGLFFLLAILAPIPVLDVHQPQFTNEVIAIMRLHKINELENNYAAAHPKKGFACQLPELKPVTSVQDPYGPDEFLLTGAQGGYKFAVADCRTGPRGVVMQYQLTAIPQEQGKSRFRAFCSDQTGATWYDANGSAENCLISRRPLQ